VSNNPLQIIANNLAARRAQLELTQADVAIAINQGLSWVKRRETARASIGVEELPALLAALKIADADALKLLQEGYYQKPNSE
jgi:transcriptional regulator with XRE-family HTH domain